MVDASPLPATPTFCSVRMNGSGKGKVGRKKREGGRCRGWGRGGGYVSWPDRAFYTGHIPSSLRLAGTQQPVISNPINIIIIAAHTLARLTSNLLSLQLRAIVIIPIVIISNQLGWRHHDQFGKAITCHQLLGVLHLVLAEVWQLLQNQPSPQLEPCAIELQKHLMNFVFVSFLYS